MHNDGKKNWPLQGDTTKQQQTKLSMTYFKGKNIKSAPRSVGKCQLSLRRRLFKAHPVMFYDMVKETQKGKKLL